ncbi:phosphoenolpyruvate--protein phosphotransferase [Roseospira visakhapatnamensis]|uniref:Phosphoenolpyruvate-protein phosphotransferase n=1 Tax=Roseospira visakhapatnamensis TaxID=390880 RepID=A0A7W6RF67_9PROT|nr:phosphoenolpyruvate--protein phosphotransferase [Roseospira visakhapatnamensis]MBB4266909.1 phosphotransferase system enzyme I (PtsI) [Roseospira visakhapatnamensis]
MRARTRRTAADSPHPAGAEEAAVPGGGRGGGAGGGGDGGDEPPPRPEMARLRGVAVGPGVGIGVVYLHDVGLAPIPEYRIHSGLVEHERLRFATAADRATKQLRALGNRARQLPGVAGEELSCILDAYERMLSGSRLLRGVDQRILDQRVNAEAAVRAEMAELIAAFSAMEDDYLAARVGDIREVGRRLIRNLTQRPGPQGLSGAPRGSVIIAEELSPADTALLNPRLVGGLVTALGARESHTAIMARSLGLPAVVAAGAILDHARAGDPVVVDGAEGVVILNPDEDTLARYRARRATFLRGRRNLLRLRTVPSISRDGVAVHLQANVELPSEVDSVHHVGAEGIGLVRSEFLFMNRDSLPGEDEQANAFCDLVRHMDGRPVTIRTLDLGGEKLGHALKLKPSANPALGLRAVRLSLTRRDLLYTQFAAILRAGVLGPVRILLPMVSTIHELRDARAVLSEVVTSFRRANRPLPDPLPPLGVMIEVPAAALSADALAREAEFFAIGTNDLTQYALAIDRTDESVAHLYDPLHPAVLRLMHFATGAAQAAGIPVSVCGEMAGDPGLTALLVGLGLRELSMATYALPGVKQCVRRLDVGTATHLAHRILGQPDGQHIADLLRRFNED